MACQRSLPDFSSKHRTMPLSPLLWGRYSPVLLVPTKIFRRRWRDSVGLGAEGVHLMLVPALTSHWAGFGFGGDQTVGTAHYGPSFWFRIGSGANGEEGR